MAAAVVCESLETFPSNHSDATAIRPIPHPIPLQQSPQSPELLELHVLSCQVGGHDPKKLHGLPMLQSNDGFVYKPLQTKGRGEKELEFYLSLFPESMTNSTQLRSSINSALLHLHETHQLSALSAFPELPASGTQAARTEVLAKLCKLVPQYHGIVEYDGINYLKLEDLTARFRRPCIVDIKIGTRTYDEFAQREKIERERSKYPPQERLGFRFVGMHVYQRAEGRYTEYVRAFGRSLDETNIIDGFRGFLNNGSDNLRVDVVPALLARLQEILRWCEGQNIFRFYSSSLLLIYEGDMPANCALAKSEDVEVRMIDFAHVFPNLPNGHSDGYVLGLRNIVSMLEQFLPSF